MATKTNDTMIEKATDKMIGLATYANDHVLHRTEQAFDLALQLTGKSVDISAKVIKKGLEISASQQEFAFNLLGGLKKKVFKNKLSNKSNC